MSVVLFVPFYKDKNELRRTEMVECLKMNISNIFIQKIVLISEEDWTPFRHPKLCLIQVSERPTYRDVFFIGKEMNPSGYNFIFNSDIYMISHDVLRAIKLLDENPLNKKLILALSRWDVKPEGKVQHYFRTDSQDSWVFKGEIAKEAYSDFYFGKPGCDNRIAYELMLQDYLIINPSKQIRSFHLHNSNIRNYKGGERVSPPYFYPIIF